MIVMIGILLMFAMSVFFLTLSALTADSRKEEIYEKIAVFFAAVTVIAIIVFGIALVIVTLSR